MLIALGFRSQGWPELSEATRCFCSFVVIGGTWSSELHHCMLYHVKNKQGNLVLSHSLGLTTAVPPEALSVWRCAPAQRSSFLCHTFCFFSPLSFPPPPTPPPLRSVLVLLNQCVFFFAEVLRQATKAFPVVTMCQEQHERCVCIILQQ